MHAVPKRVGVATIGAALRGGWRDFRAAAAASMGFAALFVGIALLLATTLVRSGLAPMVVPLIGAFMIFGPVALAGFFALRAARRAGRPASLATALGAMRHAGRPVWVMGGFCVFLVLIWLTDAGTLYSFMVGARLHDWASALPTTSQLLRFQSGAAVMGGGLALIVYVVTVHAVPLLIRGEGTLVTAVSASVRAVGRSLPAHLAWAALLALTVGCAIVLLPALLVVLPVMAYASAHWTEAVFTPKANAEE